MDLVDLEFSELWCLAGNNWSGAILLNLELVGALPNMPLIVWHGTVLQILFKNIYAITFQMIIFT
jgi:hypothetical protein